MADPEALSPRALERRIAVYRATAQELLADLRQLIKDIGAAKVRPVISLGSDGLCDVYNAVCGELEEAIDYMEAALDYLTPRADDNYPEDCAHRKLQKLTQNTREVRP